MRGGGAIKVSVFGQELVQLLDEEGIMKRQDQKPIETLESQIAESLEERSLEEPQEKSCVTPSYRAPQVFLVGKAKRLMASNYHGNVDEGNGYYYNY
jgi:hypothetical protein